MRYPALIAVLLIGVLAGIAQVGADELYIADSPTQIRPLLIGARIPDVTLATPDHQAVVLREVLAEQPTILIYYRGGW